MMKNEIIEISNISKVFRTDFYKKPFSALENVTFSVARGQITGFLGANGAGKTTLIKIIMKFIAANSGHIAYHLRGDSWREICLSIGYLPERPYFHPHLTGREFLEYMGRLNEMKMSAIVEQVKNLSVRLRIDHALDRKIKSYSKGMLQRLGMTACLLHDPEFLILDEPLSGLDPLGRKEFKNILIEERARGKSIFFSSHIVPDVEEVCQQVIFLEKGGVLYQGAIDELIVQNLKPNFWFVLNDFDETSIVDMQQKFALMNLSHKEKLTSFEVLPDQKEHCLKYILDKNYSLHAFGQVRPRLEEIFYKIKEEHF